MSNGYSVIGAPFSIPRAKPEASKENMPTEVRLHNAEAGDGVGVGATWGSLTSGKLT